MNRAEFFRLAALLVGGLDCRPSKRGPKALAVTSVPAGLEVAPVWDWNGVIGTGQSLSVGAEGTPLRATEPSYNNLKLDLGGDSFGGRQDHAPKASLVPLCKPIRRLAKAYPGPYPRNIYGETPHSAMASQVTASFLAAASGAGDYVAIHSVVGESGQAMRALIKAPERSHDVGYAYEASLFETRAIARLAKAAGRTFGVGAVVLTHGESDAEAPDYLDALLGLARDYNVDLRAITGQVTPVVLLATQQSSCPTNVGSIARSALALLEASERSRDIVCVGPKYQYSYAADGVHLDALGYDQLGEKYGQVYFERVIRGRDWQPLAPRALTRADNVIEIEFHVPVPPLRWADPGIMVQRAARPEWVNGRGFELLSGETALTIEEVTLVGTRARIRYAGQPSGPLRLRYALSAAARPDLHATVRAGQLRDSDGFIGAVTKKPQPNYAVMFERVVPGAV